MAIPATVWIVYRVRDSIRFPVALCEIEATAQRVSKVMADNGPYEEVTVQVAADKGYLPLSKFHVLPPTAADLEAQALEGEVQAVIDKIIAAGITKEEILLLKPRICS